MIPIFTAEIPCFDINQIAASGQCFRMNPISRDEKEASAYSVISGPHYLEIRQFLSDGKTQTAFCCPQEDRDFWFRYFDLDTDYQNFLSSIDPEDSYLVAAGKAGKGIRILRQDLWEMIITFIISQQKTIPAIRQAVEQLSLLFGTPLSTEDGKIFYTFPTPRQLSTASLEDLLDLKLGYRAKYIAKTVRDACSGALDLELLSSMEYASAMAYLRQFYGIGEKVANCICLFGLHHIDAFPVDTWIQKILMAEYFPKAARRYQKLPKSRLCQTIIQDHFSRYQGYAGVMQQYIFFYERTRS